MKILVTGGCGFIGAAITLRLFDEGHTVVSLHRSPPHFFDSKRYCMSILDLKQNYAKIRSFSPDAVVILHSKKIGKKNLISSPNPNEASLDPSILALVEASGCENIIFASSGGALYSEPGVKSPIDETSPIQLKTEYALEKFQTENFIEELRFANHRLNAHVVRLSNVYGAAGQNRSRSLVTAAIESGLTKKVLNIFGTTVIRDYIYIDDVVELFVNLISKASQTSHINAGTGTGTRNIDVVNTVSNLLGLKIETQIFPPLDIQAKYNVLDSSLALNLYGWYAKVQLPEGIERVIHHYRK
jgi:UDP-glucose 4-epimerase